MCRDSYSSTMVSIWEISHVYNYWKVFVNSKSKLLPMFHREYVSGSESLPNHWIDVFSAFTNILWDIPLELNAPRGAALTLRKSGSIFRIVEIYLLVN